MKTAEELPAENNDLVIEQAGLEDLESVMKVLEDAAAWLRSKGIDQWPEGRFPRHMIADSLSRGEIYLAWLKGKLAGTLTLLTEDKAIWENASEDAIYIHRLAIAPEFAGKDLGLSLIRWAERAAADAGKRYLRLDCWAENEALHRFYRKAGFSCLGEAGELADKGIYRPGWRVSLFEKELDSSLPLQPPS